MKQILQIVQKIKEFFSPRHRKGEPKAGLGALEILKYIGPGLLITVGFIDPGNWAANVAAGSTYGYNLLWMVTLSTLMLIILQHNAAHLGIATGLCLSEAATAHLKPAYSRFVLITAVLASISTAVAEILGGAIGLNMLFHVPLKAGAVITATFVAWMLFTNAYRKIEKIIIGFVSVIGLSFLYELSLVEVPWGEVGRAWVTPAFPAGSVPIIMSVLGAVVMPHNLFLHSEVIQSRQWNMEEEKVINNQLKFEFLDTLFSMIVGWAINSAMIILAAAAFFKAGVKVEELSQAQKMLTPLLGNMSAVVFAVALLSAGLASSVTAGMAGGAIFAGIFNEPYDVKDRHSRIGIGITVIGALALIFFIGNPFKGLIISQIILSMQLPFTILLQIYLTSSKKIMGSHANTPREKILLWTIAIIVITLNILLLKAIFTRR